LAVTVPLIGGIGWLRLHLGKP